MKHLKLASRDRITNMHCHSSFGVNRALSRCGYIRLNLLPSCSSTILSLIKMALKHTSVQSSSQVWWEFSSRPRKIPTFLALKSPHTSKPCFLLDFDIETEKKSFEPSGSKIYIPIDDEDITRYWTNGNVQVVGDSAEDGGLEFWEAIEYYVAIFT